MTAAQTSRDSEYIDALYGATGVATSCTRCGRPADYLTRPDEQTAWAHGTGWCLRCAPRRGRPPHHGERVVRAWLHAHPCPCGAAAVHLVTASGDPCAALVRQNPIGPAVKAVGGLAEVLTRATSACQVHAPVISSGSAKARANHAFSDATLMARTLRDPRATSLTAVCTILGLTSGGTTLSSLRELHARHTAADPSFPPLPSPDFGFDLPEPGQPWPW